MNKSMALAVVAYLVWGFAALYWVRTEPVSPIDLVAHRALWSLPVLVVLLALMGRLAAAIALLRQPRYLLILAASSLAQVVNWGIFLWAVTHEQATEASLGYFLLPLINVLIGVVAFHERPDRAQQVAILFAFIGMSLLVIENGGLPWVALGVAVSFGIYGLIRKGVSVDAVEGLFIEILLVVPLALWWLWRSGWGGLGSHGWEVDVFLLGAGIITVVPLACYVLAARQMSLTSMGLVFYLGPSCQLFVAVCLFGEPMNPVQLLSFGLVWLGLAVMVWDTVRRMRTLRV